MFVRFMHLEHLVADSSASKHLLKLFEATVWSGHLLTLRWKPGQSSHSRDSIAMEYLPLSSLDDGLRSPRMLPNTPNLHRPRRRLLDSVEPKQRGFRPMSPSRFLECKITMPFLGPLQTSQGGPGPCTATATAANRSAAQAVAAAAGPTPVAAGDSSASSSSFSSSSSSSSPVAAGDSSAMTDSLSSSSPPSAAAALSAGAAAKAAAAEVKSVPGKERVDAMLDAVAQLYYRKRDVESVGVGDAVSTQEYDFYNYPTLHLLLTPLRQQSILDYWTPYEIVLFEAGMYVFPSLTPSFPALVPLPFFPPPHLPFPLLPLARPHLPRRCTIGKNFHMLHKLIRTKTPNEIVDFYYAWKRSSHYAIWKSFDKVTRRFHAAKLAQWEQQDQIMEGMLGPVSAQPPPPTEPLSSRLRARAAAAAGAAEESEEEEEEEAAADEAASASARTRGRRSAAAEDEELPAGNKRRRAHR